MELSEQDIRDMVSRALAEDLGAGDVTTEALMPLEESGTARIVARVAGTVAGMPLAEEVFRQLPLKADFAAKVTDGAAVAAGTVLAEITGPLRSLLSGERVALNFLQRMSGIATLTRRCVEAIKPHSVKIMDTRKTTPGLRALEKYAVRVGGGVNHRIGLYDQVLIKDNHLKALLPKAGDMAGAVKLAIKMAREKSRPGMVVEVETESLSMVCAAMDAGADIILLDNMSLEEMAEASRRVRNHRRQKGSDRPLTEASGGIRLEHLADVAATGVDAISLGMLTHSATALDMAMDFD